MRFDSVTSHFHLALFLMPALTKRTSKERWQDLSKKIIKNKAAAKWFFLHHMSSARMADTNILYDKVHFAAALIYAFCNYIFELLFHENCYSLTADSSYFFRQIFCFSKCPMISFTISMTSSDVKVRSGCANVRRTVIDLPLSPE